MGTWTLAVDESGRFEPGSTGETSATEKIVVGGALFPGSASELDQKWTAALKRGCKELGVHYPPHANELTIEKRDFLLEAASRELKAVGGEWVFVADEIKGDANDLTLYPRMLGELIDLAARLASKHGCFKLDVRPAQRTVPLVAKEAERAERLGMGRGDTNEDGQVYMRLHTAAEVRQVFESLRREDVGLLPKLPEQGTVDVIAASSRIAHPAIQFADVGTNRVRALLLKKSALSELTAMMHDVPVTLVSRDALRRIRAMDRHLRATPINPVAAAREGFRATARESEGHVLLQEASTAAFFRAWTSGLEAVAAQVEKQGADAIAHSLWAGAEMHLASKSGSYEGVWHALADAWAGEAGLARKLRERLANRELAARLWRVTLECANHRGDIAAGDRARVAFNALISQGSSLVLLAEQLHVTNLETVRLQNALPCSVEDLGELRAELSKNTVSLIRSADNAGELQGLVGVDAPPTAPPRSDLEDDLWDAAGTTPAWQSPDRERGRQYGTVARSYAFLGKLDEARAYCLKARTFFGDSPFDLRFNASVLARIELETARISGRTPPSPILAAALALAGVTASADFEALAERAPKEPAVRFSLDLLLRSLLWTAPDTKLQERTVKALRKDKVFAALSSSELRTHPTELVSRHAAEVLGPGQESKRWLDLSLSVSSAAPENSAIHRFGELTRGVFDGPSGPAGCLTNPTFEYR